MNNWWDKRFLNLAKHVAEWSKDRSTGVGAVIVDPKTRTVVSLGYNGFPRGIDDDVEERHERPKKYLWTEHAERNAIYQASRSLRGCTLYTPLFPCADCARAIIQSGITRVVTVRPEDEYIERWGEQFSVAQEMFSEVSIDIKLF